jgi:hypothetical protein
MMAKTRRTQIRIETHEIKVLRLRSRPASALCARCGEIVTALTPEQTADVLGITQEDVFRLVEGERVHPVNSERVQAFICGNSFAEETEVATRKALPVLDKEKNQ